MPRPAGWGDDDDFANDSYTLYSAAPPPAAIGRRAALAGLLASGTAIATLSKIAYQTEAAGADGSIHAFQKPWFLVLVMFLGEPCFFGGGAVVFSIAVYTCAGCLAPHASTRAAACMSACNCA